MKNEAALYLNKSRRLLETAKSLATDGYADDAGRDAYLAAYHAAQAFIFEYAGKAAKTHGGVHTKFAELTRNDARFDPALKAFLPQAYNLKALADYELGQGAELPLDRAIDAVEKASGFIACIADILKDNA